jgi:signal peptidase II
VRKNNTLGFSFLWISLVIVLLDQISKTAIDLALEPGETVPISGNFFKITYVLNPGGVFGTKLGSGAFYTIVAIFAIFLAFFFFYRTLEQSWWRGMGWALILGGALGNLIDRFRFGEVLDFLDFDFIDINIPHVITLDRWPIFNLADAAVTLGMVVVLLGILFPPRSYE